MKTPHRGPLCPGQFVWQTWTVAVEAYWVGTSSNVELIEVLKRRNRRHVSYDSFKCISSKENALISIKISLHFILNGLINNIPALVRTMAWCRSGDKLLFEPMMIISLTHICVNRLQHVKRCSISERVSRHFGPLTFIRKWNVLCYVTDIYICSKTYIFM